MVEVPRWLLIAFGALAFVPLLSGGFAPGVGMLLSGFLFAAALVLIRRPLEWTFELRWIVGLMGMAMIWGAIQLVPLSADVHRTLSAAALDVDISLGRRDGAFAISRDPGATWASLRALLAGGLLFVVGFQIVRQRKDAEWTSTAIVLGATGVAALALIEVMLAGAWMWHEGRPDHARPFGPFVNRNHAATLIILALPIAASMARDARLAREDFRSQLLSTSAIVLFLALLFNGSRGGTLALLVATAVAVLCLRLPTRWKALFLAAAVLLVALPGMAGTRLGDTDTVAQRIGLMRDALSMAADSPWVGIGLGAFGVAYGPYQTVAEFLKFEHVESEPLEVLVEGGVPLLALAGFAVFMILRPVLRVARTPSTNSASTRWPSKRWPSKRWPSKSWTDKGIALGLLAALIHIAFDFSFRSPGVAIPFVMACVVLFRLDALQEEVSP